MMMAAKNFQGLKGKTPITLIAKQLL